VIILVLVMINSIFPNPRTLWENLDFTRFSKIISWFIV